jgi:hypothetical protein
MLTFIYLLFTAIGLITIEDINGNIFLGGNYKREKL